jgi:hypothetical protein
MITNLTNNNPEYLGIPMLFPVTWEENVAANMTKIPLFELFPGLLVKTIYKAYRYGIENHLIEQWQAPGTDTSDRTVIYLAGVTGKAATVILDCLNAMLITVSQGKASPDILTATAETGIEEKLPSAVSATGKAVTFPLSMVAVIALAGLVVYGISLGVLPKPGRG